MARTTARDVLKPGFGGFQFTYAEQAVSLSGLPLEAVRDTYRAMVAQAKAGNAKAEAYLPLLVQVGTGLALAQEATLAYGHDRQCVCGPYDRCNAARANDARRATTANGAIRARHRAYND